MTMVALTALLWVASATRIDESPGSDTAPRHVIFFLVDVRAIPNALSYM
eukprot:SAG11_NODE_24560_length_371_cov_1.474265_1_plen_48_part_10